MKPSNVINQLCYIGLTPHLSKEQKRNLYTVNLVSIITALFAIFGTLAAYLFIFRTSQIFFAGCLEATAFVVVLLLNRYHHYGIAALLFYMLQNVAIIYFGVKMDHDSGVQQVGFFMIGLSFLRFQHKLQRAICIGITAFSILSIELNHLWQIVTPFPAMNNHAFSIRGIVFPIGIILNVLVIVLYEGNYKALLEIIRGNSEELRKQRDELDVRSKELERANVSKSIYVRETSHEMRQPFNTMLGAGQLLMAAPPDDAIGSYRPLIESLYSAGNQGLRIINNVLEMAKIEAGKFDEIHNEVFNFRAWLNQIVLANQYLANIYGSKIVLEVGNNMPTIMLGEKNKLSQIVTNLLANAIKFTSSNKNIVIKTKLINKDRWQLIVADEGCGIPANRLPLIFEPFVSDGNQCNSTGLGLPITKKLVDLLDGNIRVESREKAGTSFTLEFPFIQVDTKSVIIADAETLTCDLSHVKVLIIEDDRMNAHILKRFLAKICGHAIIAENGAEGIRMAALESPDIILLDSFLPDMTGKEILESLKQQDELSRIPVIMVSGEAIIETQRELIKAGAKEYITKPVVLKELQQAMIRSLPALRMS
ncbi:ATP-binding response regulator [Chitinophaga nivalis]|uniref:histidine kinase n=1 Tax=Chitinophaga nivalis TaxID=2991709 RepID=A0ABT3IJ32_9BACT|nr:hybrid sensor histidine kinase/response regulator [Chitinophaga nivalis]MCW3466361.1 hybrid sensor histidine kinase/response regulator [Chitinophaga nivalis]MCW3483948.1 hybrid sensor histidine kinase/response regulator [Chitinophaga nivalis]